MSSASSPVRQALEGYVAGRVKAERLAAAVAESYYREAGGGRRQALRPIIEVIERAAPGIVALASTAGDRGFEVKLAERPFPKQYEAELRAAAVAALGELSGEGGRGKGEGGSGGSGLLRRVVAAVRRIFTASS